MVHEKESTPGGGTATGTIDAADAVSSIGATIGVEPDDVPARFLVWLGGGLTVVVVAMVIFAVWLFKSWTADELKAKGYTVTESASLGAGE